MQLTSEKRLIFVSGKGGVGKSLIAAGLAFEEAKRGRRVLLAEVGNTSYYKDFWNLQHVDHDFHFLAEVLAHLDSLLRLDS